MKYYSEELKKIFDTPEALDKAEKAEFEKKNLAKIEKEREVAARKEAADKVEAARKAMVDAQKKYREELKSFCDKYHSYHKTYEAKDINDILDLDLSNLFNFFDIWK